jgi:hypothetical protein
MALNDGLNDFADRLWLSLLELASDFCRWRAQAALKRMRRNGDSARGWFEVEKFIIRKVMHHVETSSEG